MSSVLAALSLVTRLVAIRPVTAPSPYTELGLSAATRARVAG